MMTKRTTRLTRRRLLEPGGTGLGNYDPNPMSCGDCDFETHYENELFEHLKMHLRKEANIPDDTETEVMKPLTFLFTHNMSTFNV